MDEQCRHLVAVLQLSLSPSTDVQARVRQQLEICAEAPTFAHALASIFASRDLVPLASPGAMCEKVPPATAHAVRQTAGLLLKGAQLRPAFAPVRRSSQHFLMSHVFRALRDPSARIRKTAAAIITAVLPTVGAANALAPVAELLGSNDECAVSGALAALELVCEDHAHMLDRAFPDGSRPLDTLIPALLQFMSHPQAPFRLSAVKAINHFIYHQPPILMSRVQDFVCGLSALTQSADCVMRETICKSIVALVDVRADAIVPYLDSIVLFMLHCMRGHMGDETVALAACEFWPSLCELHGEHGVRKCLQPHLPSLISVLLSCMEYSEEELVCLGDARVNHESVPDRREDMRPIFRRCQRGVPGECAGDKGGSARPSWNLRRSAASTLDALAMTLRPAVFLRHILPQLNGRLQNHDAWVVRESGVLAMGAIATGCTRAMEPHLPQLVPFLVKLLDDGQPLIRSITCWTIGRYSPWVCAQYRGCQAHRGFFRDALFEVLERCLDEHKKVQEAACSAFSVFVEFAATVRIYIYSVHPSTSNIVYTYKHCCACVLL